MPSITIRNIPEDVLAKIKKRAKKERRSLNNEIIKTLEDSNIHQLTPSKAELKSFILENDFDNNFFEGVEEAIATRTFGREINLDSIGISS